MVMRWGIWIFHINTIVNKAPFHWCCSLYDQLTLKAYHTRYYIWLQTETPLHYKLVVVCKWAAPYETMSLGIQGQRRPRSDCAVWSRLSPSPNRNTGYYKMYKWRPKAQMILCTCAGWSKPVHFEHVWRHFFAWHSPDRTDCKLLYS